MTMVATQVTDLFGLRHPVMLAPMGGVAGGELAAAVAAAGGLGLIGCGYGDPRAGYGSRAWIDEQFGLARGEPVGAGFITWALARQPDLLDLVLEAGADPIVLSFGDPASFLPRIRAAGRRVVLQVASLDEARRASALEPDVIVVQGTEAGGHGLARRSLFSLLPAVVDAVAPIPVVAAGGISDGRGMAAALVLGAEGVLLGTRLFATREALGSQAVKQRIVETSGDETIRTRVFDIVRGLEWSPSYTGRAIANAFTDRWDGCEAELAATLEPERAHYEAARRAGDLSVTAVFAGEGIDLIHDIPPARTLIERIVAEAEDRLGSCR